MSVRETQKDLEVLGVSQELRDLRDMFGSIKNDKGAGSGISGLSIKNNDVLVNNSESINFIAGTNVTINTQKNNAKNQTDITISSSGGSGSGVSIGDTIPSATQGSVLFVGAAGVLAQDNANLFWDDTNNKLLLGSGSRDHPSYSFSASTNTGFFFQTAAIRVASGGGVVASLGTEAGTVGVHFIAPPATNAGFAILDDNLIQKWLFAINSNDSNDLRLQGSAGVNGNIMRWQLTQEVGINTGGSFSGAQFFVVTSATTNVGIRVKGISSQSADYLQLRDSANTDIFKVDVNGIVTTTNNIELGNASDTTLSRSSAGVLAVEGVVVPTISSTNTLTNKRITKRTGTTTSSATPTINTDTVDMYLITAQTVDITSFTTNLSGTPTEGQKLWIAITGTAARAITWGASFESSTATLPTTTVTTNRLDVGFVWNTVTSKWRCVAVA